MPTRDQVRAYQALRGQFLNALWDAEAAGERFPMVSGILADISQDQRSDIEVQRLIETLVDDELLDGSMSPAETYPHQVALTSRGRAEVEQWLSTDRGTEHLPLPPSVTLNFNGPVQNSSIVQGSPHSTVTTIAHQEGTQLADFVQLYRTLLAEARELGPDDKEEIEADLATLDEQATGVETSPGRCRSALRRLLRWASGPVGAGASTVIREQIEQSGQDLLQLMGS